MIALTSGLKQVGLLHDTNKIILGYSSVAVSIRFLNHLLQFFRVMRLPAVSRAVVVTAKVGHKQLIKGRLQGSGRLTVLAAPAHSHSPGAYSYCVKYWKPRPFQVRSSRQLRPFACHVIVTVSCLLVSMLLAPVACCDGETLAPPGSGG